LEEKIYQLALSFTPGVGDIIFKQLVSYCGSAEKVFLASKSKLNRIPGIGQKIVNSLKNNNKTLSEAEIEFQKVTDNGCRILMYSDKEYPHRLREIYDSPPIIFYKGKADLNNSKTISIVGTRKATDYGTGVVREVIEDLKAYNPLIISGLAHGIDVSAHRNALKSGLDTVGVMATGLDIIYPYYHKKVARQMEEAGGLLTEYRMGTKPEAPHFPSRNRIIAGLSDAVIVVEAAERGGALITAELANGYSREVFAVPGNLHSSFSEGCNKLIRNHKANILTSAADIKYLLGWEDDSGSKLTPRILEDDLVELSEQGKTIVKILFENIEGVTMDELSWQAQIPVNQLSSELLTLEFKGIISSLPGKKYKING